MYFFHCTGFQKAYNYSAMCYRCFLHRILSKLDEKCRKYVQNFVCAFKYSMGFTNLFSRNLSYLDSFVVDSCNKYPKNLTDISVLI